jgi:antitoxin CptB
MNTEINKTKWKCRRGLRELDLLFRKFSNNHLESLSKQDFDMFNSILDIEDQPIYDVIFKGVSLGNQSHEDFILKRIKKFLD